MLNTVKNLGGKNPLIYLILDVFYAVKNHETFANVAGIRFTGGEKIKILSEHATIVPNVAPYQSGLFYKREMPCLLALINQIQQPFDVIVIDGFVYLTGGKAGLGKHLYDSLTIKKPIVGIAKNPFFGIDETHAVYRGTSKHPLYITTQDFDLTITKDWVKHLEGNHRIPMIINRVDKLSRNLLKTATNLNATNYFENLK